MIDFGIVNPGETLYIPFGTYASADGASITMSDLAVTDIEVYKDGSTTQRSDDAGYTLLDTDGIDFDGITGIHGFSINLADNTVAGFWAAGSRYFVVVSAITVDTETVNFVAATFKIGYAAAILNTTIATLSSQTSFTLTAGPAEDDALNGHWVLIHDVASAVQKGTAIILDYTGSTKTVTLAAGTTFTAAATDNISVMDKAPLQPATIGRTLTVESDGMAHADLKEWLGTAPLSLVSQRVSADATAISGSSTAADNAEIVFATDFATAYNTTVDGWNVNITNVLGSAAEVEYQTPLKVTATGGSTTTVVFSSTGMSTSESFAGWRAHVVSAGGAAPVNETRVVQSSGHAAGEYTLTMVSAFSATIQATDIVLLSPPATVSSGTGSGQLSVNAGIADVNATQFAGTAYATAIAAAVDLIWDEATSGHVAAGTTGLRLTRLPDATAGAAGGVLIAGSNASTTFSSLTVTNALIVSGGTALQNASLGGTGLVIAGQGAGPGIAVTGDVTVSGATTLSGAVQLGSTLGVTGAITFSSTLTSGTITANITGNITGNLSGSVGSLTTNNDKTGYALSSAGIDSIWDEVVDVAVTARQSFQISNAACGGKASGLATATATYRNPGDSANRIVATVDADGNRSAVTITYS